jgi:regulator of protease activity HflC (stomatin/prohibitin superfamily)
MSHMALQDAPVKQFVDADEDNVAPHSCGLLSCCLGTLCFGMGIFSCFTVSPKEEVVLLDYGKYNGTVKEPGVHFVCNFGRTMHKISTKVKSIMIPETKTIDRNGNPLIINGILAYQIRNSKRAALDVEYADEFVRTQGLAALKQIVARYPYEADDHVEHCLKTAADVISHEMVAVLQGRVQVAGVQVLSFTFNEISYAPEIAAGMLKRQQAQAVLAARKVIVRGAVDIAQSAVHELEQQGIGMDDKAKARVVSNLLTVICSESATAPVLPLPS